MLGVGSVPADYDAYLGHAPRRLRPVLREAGARWPHRRERGQPGPQALPVAVPGRDRSTRTARLPAAGRDHLAEEPCRRRILRLGHLPAAGQPGAPRRLRTDHRGLQGPVRPGPRPRTSAQPGAFPTRGPSPWTSSSTPPSTSGTSPPSRPPGSATRPRSRWSCPAGSSSSTPTVTTSSSTPSWDRARPRSPPCEPSATTSDSTPTRPTWPWPSGGSPTSGPPARTGDGRAHGPSGHRRTRAGPGPGGRRADAEAHAVLLGQKARELAHQALESGGLRGHRGARGLSATSGSGSTSGPGTRPAARGCSSCPGRSRRTRPGLRRPDVLWKALGKASVLHQARSPVMAGTTSARSSC